MQNLKFRSAKIPAGSEFLPGDFVIPANAFGVVIFAHGSGSSRYSHRNRYVAGVLQQRGMATLLIDLLTKDEKIDCRKAELRFDVPLLAERILSAAEWVEHQPDVVSMPIGFFGASTSSAATLVAAAQHGQIAAVVSRGGRPDLAEDALSSVSSPTLLIVGGDDVQVLYLNRVAYAQLHVPKRFEVIPEASHLFPEPGKLEQVAFHSANWFENYLQAEWMTRLNQLGAPRAVNS